MKFSEAINIFHSGLSLYITGGWMLSDTHNRILLLLIPLMYGNWLVDNNRCIFTRLENYYEDKNKDKNKDKDKGEDKDKGFIATKLNNMGINITPEQTHIMNTLISGHTYIQCYRNIVL